MLGIVIKLLFTTQILMHIHIMIDIRDDELNHDGQAGIRYLPYAEMLNYRGAVCSLCPRRYLTVSNF